MTKSFPQRGDVVTSERFRYGVFEDYRQVTIVGFARGIDVQDDAGRAAATYLVVHVSGGDNGAGSPTSTSQEVTALRLVNGKLADVIMFETKAVCHEKISVTDLVSVGHHDLAPVAPNAKLLINAKDANEAATIAASLLGFVPTNAPVKDGDYWLVPGHSFRQVEHEKVVGLVSLLVVDSPFVNLK